MVKPSCLLCKYREFLWVAFWHVWGNYLGCYAGGGGRIKCINLYVEKTTTVLHYQFYVQTCLKQYI